MRAIRGGVVVAVAGVVASSGVASADVGGLFDFLVNPATSGLDANIATDVTTEGTLIGDWDAVDNPTGTRTKPGLFGSFGTDENVAVPVGLGLGLGDDVLTTASGGFRMAIRPGMNSVEVSGYAVDALSGANLNLPAVVSLSPDSFRTRNPDSTFIGIPINLPIGQVTVSQLSFTQIGPAVPGILSNMGGGIFEFNALVPVQIDLTLSFLGNDLPMTSLPGVIPLGGTLVEAGDGVDLASVRLLDFSQMQEPGTALPQFPLPLPTILPPGGTANVLFDLVLERIDASITGSLTLNAHGTRVPAPGVVGALGLAGLMGLRRRR